VAVKYTLNICIISNLQKISGKSGSYLFFKYYLLL